MMTGNDISIRMDEVLTSLPAMHVIASQGDARFVVSVSGAFVLAPSTCERVHLLTSAKRLEDLTMVTRDALCQHLTWVPFLDTLVVTADDPPRSLSITTAPLDLLHDVLTEGPRVIAPTAVTTIRDAIRRSALDGWRAGLLRGDGKIDLCDPVQPSPTI